jgi:hypothetical protein
LDLLDVDRWVEPVVLSEFDDLVAHAELSTPPTPLANSAKAPRDP